MADGPGFDDVLEELGPPEAEAFDEAEDEGSPDFSLLDDPGLGTIAHSFAKLLIPLAIMDPSLRFIFRNDALNGLLARFEYADRPSFPSMFAAPLGEAGVKSLRAALGRKGGPNFWRGELRHRARHTSAQITKAIVFPYSNPLSGSLEPLAYTVLFDDITEEHQRMLMSMFRALLDASMKKDQDTTEHVERVNLYSRALAQSLYDHPEFPQVDKDFIQDIGFLAAMHDVGKIGTPDDILHKPGALEPWEWSVMKEHTLNGAYILATYPNPMARDIARSHHEKWDGSGYPYQLSGELIPLAARIAAVADVYDALRSKRPYKPGLSHGDTLAKMAEGDGSHFDPRIFKCFLDLEREFERIFGENSKEG